MTKTYSVLIIEDHPLIIEAYKRAFSQISTNNKTLNFNIETATNCDSAYLRINDAKVNNNIDIVFLDIKLPPSKDGNIMSGEDLGAIIRKNLSKVKIIVATTFSDNYRLNAIFKNINPEGFLVKNDLNPKELVLAINTMLNNESYYCKTVLKLMRKHVSNDIIVDTIDRRLLFELSRGSKMTELPQIIPLSLAAIEKRKRRLKQVFGIGDKSDRKLLQIAEEKGFI